MNKQYSLKKINSKHMKIQKCNKKYKTDQSQKPKDKKKKEHLFLENKVSDLEDRVH